MASAIPTGSAPASPDSTSRDAGSGSHRRPELMDLLDAMDTGSSRAPDMPGHAFEADAEHRHSLSVDLSLGDVSTGSGRYLNILRPSTSSPHLDLPSPSDKVIQLREDLQRWSSQVSPMVENLDRHHYSSQKLATDLKGRAMFELAEKYPEALKPIRRQLWPQEYREEYFKVMPNQMGSPSNLQILNEMYREYKAQVDLIEKTLQAHVDSFRW
ncbi:uncharacterized protein UTRI_04869 [Ustilago trichophora]|uniref:Uncharacterized protein n=1 Tax=Ustilago trichophora TaxID=86804 RepID=A0A5C3EDB1_9BASI|nr:uncharacterized protein UTRI_04869 [Ustilago trichophora]